VKSHSVLSFLLSTFSFFLFPFSFCPAATAGQPVAPPAPPTVKSEELQRAVRKPTETFPWANSGTRVTPKGPTPAEGALAGMTSGDLILKSWGEFSREQKKAPGPSGTVEEKEVLTLNKDVEIEQVQSKFVLRGQKIHVSRDLKTGQTDQLEAKGNVEIFSPERCGRGELLLYETKYGPNGETLKDQYTIDGGPNGRANLWQGDDWLEADKFVSDQRLGTFRLLGRPIAVVTLPSAAAAAKEPAQPKAASGGMFPTLNLSGGGGKLRIQADGEMFYESSVGRIRLARNVTITQEAGGQQTLKLLADEALISLLPPPPGQQPSGNSMFAGPLKSMDCSGRVELRTPGNVILFDKGNLDMQRNVFVMQMKNPKDDVRVYSQEGASGGSVFIAPKSLTVNLETQDYSAGGPMRRQSYEGSPPSSRAPQKQ
jgi:hypothetical protein